MFISFDEVQVSSFVVFLYVNLQYRTLDRDDFNKVRLLGLYLEIHLFLQIPNNFISFLSKQVQTHAHTACLYDQNSYVFTVPC